MLLFLPYVGSSSLTEQHLILVVKTKFEHSFSSASLIDGNCLHSRGQEQQQAKDLSENTSTFFKWLISRWDIWIGYIKIYKKTNKPKTSSSAHFTHSTQYRILACPFIYMIKVIAKWQMVWNLYFLYLQLKVDTSVFPWPHAAVPCCLSSVSGLTALRQVGNPPNVTLIESELVCRGMYRQSKEASVMVQLISYSVLFHSCKHLRSSFINRSHGRMKAKGPVNFFGLSTTVTSTPLTQ